MSLKSMLHNHIFLKRMQKRNANASSAFWRRLKHLFWLLIIISVVLLVQSNQFQALLTLLSAPNLPHVQTLDANGEPLEQVWLKQNWGDSEHGVSPETQRYHHISQGTATLSMPYQWFLSLEEPNGSLWSTLGNSLIFKEKGKLADDDYLLRFGFIRGQQDPVYNPDGLPIGFAKTSSINIPGLPVKTDAIGFTCAACHTGHFTQQQDGKLKEYVIEGGPATTDLGQLTAAIAASLGQTALSSKLPLFDNRFDRFAQRVLGTQYSAVTKAELAADLQSLIEASQQSFDIVDVQEGFSRLDALNRIGNQVFAKDLNRRENYQPINAPVNYPHIWTASWFKWVQYDGSIMQPLVRNVGESMGVSAQISFDAKRTRGHLQSSIPVENLIWLEDFLMGDAFNQGLQAPKWPFAPVQETSESYQLGKSLYEERCQGCHLPVIGDDKIKQHLKPIKYMRDGKPHQTKDHLLDVVIVDQQEIGTDPAQGDVLVSRMVNTTAKKGTGSDDSQQNAVGVNGIVCGQNTEQLLDQQFVTKSKKHNVDLVDGLRVTDGGDLSFALGLGAVVQQTIQSWFDKNFIKDEKLIDELSGGRPNCLQAGQGYKARPLNGVWATAPFLHNGSVATIRDLICKPQQDRPKYVILGDIRYDPENVGLYQASDSQQLAAKTRESGNLYTDAGLFVLDTRIAGNSNLGHSFSKEYVPPKEVDGEMQRQKQQPGVIGPEFSDNECDAILDYLKVL